MIIMRMVHLLLAWSGLIKVFTSKPLAKEFAPYRIENNLWGVPIKSVKYRTDDDGNTFRYRMTDDILSEPEVFYNVKK